MQVLLSAFFISPERGSEAGVGWNYAVRIAAHHNVTVLCGNVSEDLSQKAEIEAWFDAHPETRRFRVVALPGSQRARLWERMHRIPGLHFLYYAAYRDWQIHALEAARIMHRDQPFDLVHHITIGSYREPGYLWELGIPFFLGPVSGRGSVPLTYLRFFNFRSKVEHCIRFLLNSLTQYLNPRVRAAAKHTALIWCVSPNEEAFFRRLSGRTELMTETATPAIAGRVRVRDAAKPLRLVWSGIHLPRKALPILIESLQLAGANVHVDVLGVAAHGSSVTEDAKRQAKRLGVAGQLVWHGMLPRNEAMAIMDGAEGMIHTSLAEGTPWVVMEALAMGLPVVCHDLGGMGPSVDASCGIKIEPRGPTYSIQGFADAIRRLRDENGLLDSLSQGAILRAKKLGWEMKVQRVLDAYRDSDLLLSSKDHHV